MSKNFSEENKKSDVSTKYLEELFSGENTIIMIDTCATLDKGFLPFMEHVKPFIQKYNKRIILPFKVLSEISSKLKDKDPELRKTAFDVFCYCAEHCDTYFQVLGTEKDNFPDNLFQELYAKFRQRYHAVFITQDKDLAADLLNMSDSKSVQAYGVTVKRIMPDGYLNNLHLVRENEKWINPAKRSTSAGKSVSQKASGIFKKCNVPTSMPDEVLPVTEIPGEFATVYAKQPTKTETSDCAQVILQNLISSGGEGCVYETNTNLVAKIYKEGKVTTRRKAKVLMMAANKLDYSGISFPVLPLYNGKNEFVGYLMKMATGEELRTSLFCPVPKFKEKHPDWKRDDLVRICIAILKKVEYLHSKNIIIGDLNPGNILVKSPTEVFFVDTDSYQIEDFPCPVGQCNYTAPEIQGKEYNSFLRTMGNENFALATLLFQIMLPGKLPYAHAGGGRQNENILEMNFPYCFKEKSNKNAPDGLWKFIWSHLAYDVKGAFYNTFQKGGTYASENQRLSATDWMALMKSYLCCLEKGIMTKNDPMSDAIFPTRYKASKDAKWAVCAHCGEKFPYYESKSSKSSNPPTHCPSCRQTICEWIVCDDCGEEFPIYAVEYDYYKNKKYNLPKRCPSCRKKYKAEEAQKKELRRNGGLVFDQKMPELIQPKPPVVNPEPRRKIIVKRLTKRLVGA